MVKGDQLVITLFDDLLAMINGYPPLTCGMDGYCQPQLVIEANGNCYPCDFYALDKYYLGNITNKGIEELLNSELIKDFARETRANKEYCSTCSFFKLCHGGCKRLNSTFLQKDYCGLKALLEQIMPILVRIR